MKLKGGHCSPSVHPFSSLWALFFCLLIFKLVCVLISRKFRHGSIFNPMAKYLAPGGLKMDQLLGSSYWLNNFSWLHGVHYNDITMGMMASPLTGIWIVYSTEEMQKIFPFDDVIMFRWHPILGYDFWCFQILETQIIISYHPTSDISLQKVTFWAWEHPYLIIL